MNLLDSPAILFLASWYPVSSNPSHGIFIKLHALALSSLQNVIVVYAYSATEGPFFQIEKKEHNKTFTEYLIKYPKAEGVFKKINSFNNYRKSHKILLNTLVKERVNVLAIQVNVIFPVAIALSIYKKIFKVKHTAVEHWSGYLDEDGNYKGLVLKYFTIKCISKASKVWYVSNKQKEAMQAHGLHANYELLFNAVDTNLFIPRPKLDAKIKLLHVSSLVEKEKNISGTFRVIKKLQDKKCKFNFIVAGGEGDELQHAKKISEEFEIENIVFTGNLPREKISELMQQSNALILFSHFEGMPVVALEALACGLPVIASGVGQLPNIIRNGFGVLVDEGNEAELLNVLERFILNEYSFNQSAMREFVMEHASYDAVGKQMNNFYESLR